VKCEDVVFTGVSVYNPISYNTDGLAIESCKNVRVSDCFFDTDDDCISIKSGKGKKQRENGVPCENITITNCVFQNGAAGVCIGSEMSASVRNVTVSNCIMDGTKEGLFIKSVRGRGGVVENFVANNIIINNITKYSAIRITMMYWFKTEPEPVSERTPTFRGFHFSNIYGNNNNQAIEILGLEERNIENITFSNIGLEAKYGMTAEFAENIQMNNCHLNVKENPAFNFKNITDLYINNCKNLIAKQNDTTIVLSDVNNSFINGCFPQENSGTFLHIKGKKTENIYLRGNNFVNKQHQIKIDKDVKSNIFY
jgi:polygalacturonase